MKNTITIGFILGCMVMIACQQEIPTEGIKPIGIYTLSGNLESECTDSRAQIKLGKTESGKEIFFWNKEDRFALYQYRGEQLDSTIFTISDFYEESDSKKSTNASFKAVNPAYEGKYVAIYPAHTPLVDGNVLQFSFIHDLDFTNAITPEEKKEVWKQYIKDHMFMKAEGNLIGNQFNVINFKHLCTLLRVTLTNETGKDMNVEYISFGYNQFYETSRQFVMLPNNNFFGSSGSTNRYQVNTKNLKILSGETMDFYIFFFPKEFGEGSLISITLGGNYPSLFMNNLEISNKNQGATGFEAGKRYWFKVSNTLEGMMWSKDFVEFGLDGELITIENPMFSNLLQNMFGNKYITINEEGNAVMHQSFTDWVKELNINHMNGIETLAGIECFKNLEKLSARVVNLKEVDVSKNLALKYLDLSYNPDIKQLDLSKNVLLEDLQLTDMPISSIDLSPNVNLEAGLLLVNMPITQLDLSKNVKLKQLNCRSCKISELDITPLTQLEKLYCGGQQDNITIKVYMTEKQKELWDTEWCNNWENVNVEPIIK